MRKLKICHISDMHGKHKYLQIPECDVLVCSGDISMMGYKNELESFFSWFKRRARATYKILVAGNHDLTFDPQRGGNKGDKPEWLKEMISSFENDEKDVSKDNYYLENQSIEIEGVKFWGSPTSAWFHGDRWAFNLKPEDSKEIYSTIPQGTDVVITHGPAYGHQDYCLDVCRGVGDMELGFALGRIKPLLHLFGHIHESYGYSSLRGMHFFNGCNCDLSYEVVNKPRLIEANFDNKEVEVLNEGT